PTVIPTSQPSGQPTNQPTNQPSGQPTVIPTSQPSGQPTNQPTGQPSLQLRGVERAMPTTVPSGNRGGNGHGLPMNCFLNNLRIGEFPTELQINAIQEDYICRMRSEGESGDHLTLMAAANHYGVRIIVHDTNQPEGPLRFDPQNNGEVRHELNLVFSPGHYMQYMPNGNPIDRGGEGNCQFAAIAAELQRVGLMDSNEFQAINNIVQRNTHMRVRQSIIQELLINKELYQNFIIND
ncbi:MAG: PT domain-containing protein, partial [Candidatus Margulisiibacteriota bacterium]